VKKQQPRSPSRIDILVGANIRRQREAKGLTQTALGEAMGVSFQQVQKIEKGANRISAGHLYAAAKLLDCKINVFFDPRPA